MSDRHFAFWPRARAAPPDAAADQPVLQRRGLGGALSRQAVHHLLRHAAHVRARSSTRPSVWPDTCSRTAACSRAIACCSYMQNSPQFIIAYYAILRANAVVVPVNPMNLTEELRALRAGQRRDGRLRRAGAVPQHEAAARRGDGERCEHVVVAAYSDYLAQPTDLPVPDVRGCAAPADRRRPASRCGATRWRASARPGPLTAGPDDLCVMPYSSGTTGQPKGCMHTHRSVMHTLVGGVVVRSHAGHGATWRCCRSST